MPGKTPLQQPADHGQSVWIGFLSRQLLHSGELARMMKEDAVVGVTSNPTIFQRAISQGSAYDEQLQELLGQETDPKEVFLQLSALDIAEACDLLRPVHDETGGLDGFVSWEVDPTLAYDREGTFEEMMRLHAWIDRPNLYVKIPATKPGLGAIEDAVAHGKNINVTLIFSLQRYRDVMYVEELIGPMTVDTMPQETIDAFQDHGVVEPTLTKGLKKAQKLFEDLAAAGVDYDDVTETLEQEGVQKFADSFTELLE